MAERIELRIMLELSVLIEGDDRKIDGVSAVLYGTVLQCDLHFGLSDGFDS